MKSALHGTPTMARAEASMAARAVPFEVRPRQRESRSSAIPDEEAKRFLEIALWLLVAGIFVLGLVGGYLLWAKVTAAWPFSL